MTTALVLQTFFRVLSVVQAPNNKHMDINRINECNVVNVKESNTEYYRNPMTTCYKADSTNVNLILMTNFDHLCVDFQFFSNFYSQVDFDQW